MRASFQLGRLAAALTLSGAVFLAAACGSDNDKSTAASGSGSSPQASSTTTTAPAKKIGEGLTIGFTPAVNCANETICNIEKGFKAEAKALGAKAIVLENSGTDPINDAIKHMDQMIAQKVDAMAFWPLDPGAMKAPTARAVKAGIPVFAHDLYDGAAPGVVASITEGRELKAKQAAEQICKKAPDGGDVIYGNFALPAPTLNFLVEKFKSYLKQCSGGKSKVVATFQNKTDDVAGSRPNAEAAIQSHPNAIAVDNYNDPTAIGASQAASDLGKRGKLWISGYNLAQNGVDALKSGRIDVSWDYRPVVIGQLLARTMVEYAAGKNKSPDKIIMVWAKCYTKDTIGDLPPVNQQLADIAAGKDLSAADPDLIEKGDSIPTPGDNLPGC